jgi:hypothetical protein
VLIELVMRLEGHMIAIPDNCLRQIVQSRPITCITSIPMIRSYWASIFMTIARIGPGMHCDDENSGRVMSVSRRLVTELVFMPETLRLFRLMP